MKNKITVLAALILTIVLYNCAGYQDYGGTSILVKLNEETAIKLEADTSKGYSWIVSNISDRDIAKYTGKEYIPGENGKNLPMQVIKIKGLKKGKAIISLNYVKKDDLLVKKSRTFNLTVY
ncbi:MAG: protease inhibitor I42 family protein [Ignavibacteria bacterium]|nr:protease inhibitor I42 family protein [Ignavibacteria bacterium]